jgi:hypothetical protein
MHRFAAHSAAAPVISVDLSVTAEEDQNYSSFLLAMITSIKGTGWPADGQILHPLHYDFIPLFQ